MALHLLREMLRIRRFEERCVELYSAAKIRGFLHLYIGEEAVAVGAMQALDADDAVVATYREHGHALVRGVPAGAVMAEMFGKADGCSRGRGGSMHLFDAARASTAATPSSPAACRSRSAWRWPTRCAGRSRVTACFFGEGAVAEGEFHESMNLAALWRLPVLFCCENNLYAMGTALARSESETDLALKAAGYEMPAWSVDGMDVLAVEDAVAARGAGGARRRAVLPGAADLPLPRPLDVRPRALPQQGRGRALDAARPDRAVGRPSCASGALLDDAELERIEQEVAAEIDEAVAFAEAAELEPVEDLERFVYAEQEAAA